jgi:penicillin amidase
MSALLKDWDGDCRAELAAPLVFNVFFVDWSRRVAAERFSEQNAPFVLAGIEGLAAELLRIDRWGWFGSDRPRAVRETFRATLKRLAERLGPDPAAWHWGKLHRLDLKHVLAGRGEVGALLNHGGAGVPGDMTTVCNTGRGPDFEATTGAGYRMICDLGETPAGLWAVDAQSQSGHPGSPHYGDQFAMWLAGEYHFIALDREEARKSCEATLRLEPGTN